MRHLQIVAAVFRLTGLALAIASILTLADLADTALVMRQMPPVQTGQHLDIGTYGIVALLTYAASGFAWAMHVLAGVADILLVALAIGAVLVLLLGALLYLTGRGIRHHARWARLVAVLISAALALASCAAVPALLANRQDLAPFAALPIVLGLYSLWVLTWRFG